VNFLDFSVLHSPMQRRQINSLPKHCICNSLVSRNHIFKCRWPADLAAIFITLETPVAQAHFTAFHVDVTRTEIFKLTQSITDAAAAAMTQVNVLPRAGKFQVITSTPLPSSGNARLICIGETRL
jgi:hypothetical protein